MTRRSCSGLPANHLPVVRIRALANRPACAYGTLAAAQVDAPGPVRYPAAMTSDQKNIVRSLIAFAWVDGKFVDPEAVVIDGMLAGFDASDEEKAEFTEYGKTRRTLHDIPVSDLKGEHRELLLANAAMLTHADGDQANVERVLLKKLSQLLGFSNEEAERIVEDATDGALRLPKESLIPENQPPRRTRE